MANNSGLTVEKHSWKNYREQLDKAQKTCAELRIENLRYVEIIRKLTEELNASKSLIDIPRKRAEALERYRLEYANRTESSGATDVEYLNNEGFDEIDGLS